MQKINLSLDYDQSNLTALMEAAVRELVSDNSDEVLDMVIDRISKTYARTKSFIKELDRKDYYKIHFADDEVPDVDECVIAFDGYNYGNAWWNGEDWKTTDTALVVSGIVSWRHIEPQE